MEDRVHRRGLLMKTECCASLEKPWRWKDFRPYSSWAQLSSMTVHESLSRKLWTQIKIQNKSLTQRTNKPWKVHSAAWQHFAINQILIAFLCHSNNSPLSQSKNGKFIFFESNRSVYIFILKKWKRGNVSCAKQNGDKKFTMLHSSSLDSLHDVKNQ